MAEAIVGGPLLRILEGFIGFVEFFEFLLGGAVARVLVGMVLFGELAECGLQVLLAGPFGNAQGLIIVALGHGAGILGAGIWRQDLTEFCKVAAAAPSPRPVLAGNGDGAGGPA